MKFVASMSRKAALNSIDDMKSDMSRATGKQMYAYDFPNGENVELVQDNENRWEWVLFDGPIFKDDSTSAYGDVESCLQSFIRQYGNRFEDWERSPVAGSKKAKKDIKWTQQGDMVYGDAGGTQITISPVPGPTPGFMYALFDFFGKPLTETILRTNWTLDEVKEELQKKFENNKLSSKKVSKVKKADVATTTEIDESWIDYDKSVARTHLHNFGVIFLDDYGAPIDDEYWIEEILEERGASRKASRKRASIPPLKDWEQSMDFGFESFTYYDEGSQSVFTIVDDPADEGFTWTQYSEDVSKVKDESKNYDTAEEAYESLRLVLGSSKIKQAKRASHGWQFPRDEYAYRYVDENSQVSLNVSFDGWSDLGGKGVVVYMDSDTQDGARADIGAVKAIYDSYNSDGSAKLELGNPENGFTDIPDAVEYGTQMADEWWEQNKSKYASKSASVEWEDRSYKSPSGKVDIFYYSYYDEASGYLLEVAEDFTNRPGDWSWTVSRTGVSGASETVYEGRARGEDNAKAKAIDALSRVASSRKASSKSASVEWEDMSGTTTKGEPFSYYTYFDEAKSVMIEVEDFEGEWKWSVTNFRDSLNTSGDVVEEGSASSEEEAKALAEDALGKRAASVKRAGVDRSDIYPGAVLEIGWDLGGGQSGAQEWEVMQVDGDTAWLAENRNPEFQYTYSFDELMNDPHVKRAACSVAGRRPSSKKARVAKWKARKVAFNGDDAEIFIGAFANPSNGDWVRLPATDEEINKAIEKAQTGENGEYYEEVGIFDTSGLGGIDLEYENIHKVNEWVTDIEDAGLPDEVVEALIYELGLQYAAEKASNGEVEYFEGVHDERDLGHELVDAMGGTENLDSNTLEMYFDYEGFGRDTIINDGYVIDNGFAYRAASKQAQEGHANLLIALFEKNLKR